LCVALKARTCAF
jgi:hypothetical protein